MFDPFNDFATAGYLRNVAKAQDPRIVKRLEHESFLRNLPRAISYLSGKQRVEYADVLEVHRILFSAFYPWAGSDRSATSPSLAISKGTTKFCRPRDIRRANDEGLRLSQDCKTMKASPGMVMGLFAYGHPFLDGNGRAILVVHLELSFRAGFSIAWGDTNKDDYLAALSAEIESPGSAPLDTYLRPFIREKTDRYAWADVIGGMQGLDGFDEGSEVDGDLSDEAVSQQYAKFEKNRGYAYAQQPKPCSKCKMAPCTCPRGMNQSIDFKYS